MKIRPQPAHSQPLVQIICNITVHTLIILWYRDIVCWCPGCSSPLAIQYGYMSSAWQCHPMNVFIEIPHLVWGFLLIGHFKYGLITIPLIPTSALPFLLSRDYKSLFTLKSAHISKSNYTINLVWHWLIQSITSINCTDWWYMLFHYMLVQEPAAAVRDGDESSYICSYHGLSSPTAVFPWKQWRRYIIL